MHWALREIFGVLGLSRISQADNGTEFVNKLVQRLMDDNMVQYRHGSVRKPQTQGLVERGNGHLKTLMFKFLAQHNLTDWLECLYEVQHAINITVNKNKKFSVRIGTWTRTTKWCMA